MKLEHKFSVKYFYAAAASTLTLLLFLSVTSTSREVKGEQEQARRIKFSHKLHVADQGIACTDCHSTATASKSASDNLLARKANCETCHEDQLKKECTFCHTSADSSTYVPLENPVRAIVFSHETHVGGQKVPCETCHQGLNKDEGGISSHIPNMAVCSTCHNGIKAQDGCETCHTDFAALRPKEHNNKDFVREHRRIARVADASCATCHSQESCADCHNGVALVKVDVPGKDLTSPRSPRLTANDRGQGIALSKVHDLNFRFTHGVVASGRIAECQTCHTIRNFCSTCHQAGGNVNQARFKPETHLQAGFVTIGVGSGGGKHASWARRDIETCAACHDAQGADPTCLTCHTDADGVKGTDPRTHPKGFMAGVHGEWHSDQGSTCFMCHIDPNARTSGVKGQGFCGYCHK